MDVTGRDRASRSELAAVDKRTGSVQPINFFHRQMIGSCAQRDCYLRLRFLVGNFLRLVLATRRSSFRLIDLYICRDAPRSEDFER